jgi:hypothetical protein
MTQDELKQRLHYDPETGIFTRIQCRYPSKIGTRIGSKLPNGYRYIELDGGKYLEHRLVWLYVHGSFPEIQIDHIDRDKTNNKLSNLREATISQNQWNRPMNRNNTSGYTGVYFNKQSGKWQAYIRVNNKQKHLGSFANPELAHEAQKRAKAELHTFNPIL